MSTPITRAELQQYFNEMDGSTTMGYSNKEPLRVATSFGERNGEPVLIVEMRNIPESGGAHMMPGAWKIPTFLQEQDLLDYDSEYVELNETYKYGGRQKKGLNLYVPLP